MKVKLTLTLLSIFLRIVVFSQNHVSWKFSYDKTLHQVMAIGKIDPTWHIYSQKTDPNSGPVATILTVNKTQGVKPIGVFEENLVPHEIYDTNFESKVYLFEQEYQASQNVKIKNVTELSGSIFYMVCDDTKCLPTIEVPFTISIK